ncbi:MAG: ATP-dependent DNA helicase RecG [Pseudomonadota bacterium]
MPLNLSDSLQHLSGMNARLLKPLAHLVGGDRVFDLLTHAPIDTIARQSLSDVSTAQAGQQVQLSLHILKHAHAFRRGAPTRVHAVDTAGNSVHLVFFNANKPFLEKILPLQKQVTVAGTIDKYNIQWQIIHPEVVKTPVPAKPDNDTQLEPIYPLTQGITTRILRDVIGTALQKVEMPAEWLDATLLGQHKWPGLGQALNALHSPTRNADIQADAPARTRLAFDELLAHQLGLALVRTHMTAPRGVSFTTHGPKRQALLAALPFTLTHAQTHVLAQIDTDMAASTRMLRLLQGDVGSGKTIVAALALMNAVDSGAQGALMAPTEILARQHATTLQPLLAPLGVRVVCLTGRDKGKTRTLLLKQIRDGMADIIIGTHALFQDQVAFQNLGLAVIDEQHRFGVHQRLQLSAKGLQNDVLVMTATPIPRTLALTLYGDMDVSKLDGKPPGRQKIDTRLISADRMGELIAGLARHITQGAQIYWVCPLVEESEIMSLAAATARHADLQQHFGSAEVGLIHGQMKDSEKDAAMADFMNGRTRILVATTVIEVGVNVPSATVMVIEHAERFGLAQLHQLRGRVGRGSAASHCVLLYHNPVSETARARLQMMRDSEDGFLLAEKDMELRGSGDMLGTRQSGLPDFRMVDFVVHRPLFEIARDAARYILSRDPHLVSPQGRALQTLLALHRRDTALSLLLSG